MAGGSFAGWLGTSAAFYFGAAALRCGGLILGWLLWGLPSSAVNGDWARQSEVAVAE